MRKARVFISCGQRLKEVEVARGIESLLRDELGFDPYVAISTQTLAELGTNILEALKGCDYFVFVNLERSGDPVPVSLFSHQELAMAYACGFESSQMLVIQCGRAVKDGLQKLFVSNVPDANDFSELPEVVRRAVEEAGWHPSFSRHLRIFRQPWWGEPCIFEERRVRVLYADVHNGRTDIPAYRVIGRLRAIRCESFVEYPISDQSRIKASEARGFEHTIWPGDTRSFDLLAHHLDMPHHIYLHSEHDTHPRQPVIMGADKYALDYEFIAERFPLLRFTLELDLNQWTSMADGGPPAPDYAIRRA